MNALRSCYVYISWLFTVLFFNPSPVSNGLVFGQKYHSNFVFGKLNVENGLSSNVVNAILQDKSGLLWFGTENGLNRFDGYEFKVYKKDPNDTNSISDNGIWSLFEDRKGQIWVGTKNGELNCYNPSTEKFKRITLPSAKIKGNSITCIYEDSKNNLWIGTYKDGLYRFSLESKKFEHWHNQKENYKSLSNNYVTSVCEDNSGRILVGTYNGLNIFEPGSPQKPFERFYSEQDNEQSLSNNLIWSITKSNYDNNYIWICTLSGLTKYNSESNSLSRVKIPADTKLSLGNSISSIMEDSVGGDRIIWIGTYGGLLRINMSSELSERFSNEVGNENGIVSNQINFLYKDRSDVVWIGTNNGINFFSHKRVKFNYLFQYSKNVRGIDELFYRNIGAITQSENGTVWLGTNNGLYYLQTGGQSIVRKFNKTSAMHIWSIARGAGNKLWISTYGDGLKMLDLKSGIIKPVNLKNRPQAVSAYNYIKSITQDRNGTLWMGFWAPV